MSSATNTGNFSSATRRALFRHTPSATPGLAAHDKSRLLVLVTVGTATVSRWSHLRKAVFSDPYFDVRELTLKDAHKEEAKGNTIAESLLITALKRSRQLARDQPVLVVSDRMTSTGILSNQIGDQLKEVISKLGPHIDLCYLSRYLDLCQLNTPLDNGPKLEGAPQFFKTLAPNGLGEAVLFMPSGRDAILGKRKLANGAKFKVEQGRDLNGQVREEIYRSSLTAICSSPGYFRFDWAANATRNTDFLKANECAAFDMMSAPGQGLPAGAARAPPGSDVDSSGGNAEGQAGFQIPGPIWFFVVLLVILLAGWCLYYLWPGKTTSEAEREAAEKAENANNNKSTPEEKPDYGVQGVMEANHNGGSDGGEWLFYEF